jgi:hypothetical protein
MSLWLLTTTPMVEFHKQGAKWQHNLCTVADAGLQKVAVSLLLMVVSEKRCTGFQPAAV